MTEQTKAEPTDVISTWPPVSHIIRKEDEPAREGTIALCGTKLMGIDLSGDVRKATCKECLRAMSDQMRFHQ